MIVTGEVVVVTSSSSTQTLSGRVALVQADCSAVVCNICIINGQFKEA